MYMYLRGSICVNYSLKALAPSTSSFHLLNLLVIHPIFLRNISMKAISSPSRR